MENEMSSAISADVFQMLFESIDEGVCIIQDMNIREIEFVNFRYIYVNPAFKKIARLSDVVGKMIFDIFPAVSDSTMHAYNNVVKMGKAVRFETYEKALDQWLSVYVFLIGEPQLKRVAVI